MVQLSIKHNFADVQRKLDELEKDVREKVVASSLNKTMEQARTQMIREITSEFNIKAGDVRDMLRISRASFRQGAFGMSATLSAPGKRSLNLKRFIEKFVTLAEGRRRLKAGNQSQLRFQIKKTGGKTMLPGAFVATANGGTAVFRRVGKGRYPIQAISTVGIPSMFNTKRINAKVVEALRSKFPEIVDRDIAFYLSKFRGL